jgi:hypothetical protein
MDSLERDDFIHALTQTMHFYGKELDRGQVAIWVTACNGKAVEKLKKAFMEHLQSGRYAPRPAEILALVDGMAKIAGRNELPAPPTTKCPPEIAKAWMWFIGRTTQDSNVSLFQDNIGIDVDTQEKYLEIVNFEAHKYGNPAAIPKEFRLEEIWAK